MITGTRIAYLQMLQNERLIGSGALEATVGFALGHNRLRSESGQKHREMGRQSAVSSLQTKDCGIAGNRGQFGRHSTKYSGRWEERARASLTTTRRPAAAHLLLDVHRQEPLVPLKRRRVVVYPQPRCGRVKTGTYGGVLEGVCRTTGKISATRR